MGDSLVKTSAKISLDDAKELLAAPQKAVVDAMIDTKIDEEAVIACSLSVTSKNEAAGASAEAENTTGEMLVIMNTEECLGQESKQQPLSKSHTSFATADFNTKSVHASIEKHTFSEEVVVPLANAGSVTYDDEREEPEDDDESVKQVVADDAQPDDAQPDDTQPDEA